jgi:hypothetical protein
MLLELGTFFFVLLGSKLVLGAIAVYMLLPADDRCDICDAQLLPIEHPRGTARVLRLLRLQRHWCMECRRESLTRYQPRLRLRRTRPAAPVAEHRIR